MKSTLCPAPLNYALNTVFSAFLYLCASFVYATSIVVGVLNMYLSPYSA